MSHASRFILSCLCLLVLSPIHAVRAEDGDGLPDYFGESSWLLSPPGMAPGLAAGLFNPAAYGVAENNGLYLGWRGNDALSVRRGDLDFSTSSDDFAGVVSLRNLSFSVQHFDFDPDAFDAELGAGAVGDDPSVTDYSLSIGGNRDGGIGLSYSWAGGDRDLMACCSRGWGWDWVVVCLIADVRGRRRTRESARAEGATRLALFSVNKRPTAHPGFQPLINAN